MTRNKITALLCSLLIFSSLFVFGQEDPKGTPLNYQDIGKDEGIISKIDGENQQLKAYLKWMDVTDLNLVTLRQMGQQNQASVQQIRDSQNPNLVWLHQDGNQNTADVTQKGHNNAVYLRQEGSHNSFAADYEGKYLINNIVQQGQNNTIEQSLQGSDMDFSIHQQGSGHELIQSEKGMGVGYKVTQKGTDMRIRIEQGHVMVK